MKRKQPGWLNEIGEEETGASLLIDPGDKETAHCLVNTVYSMRKCDANGIQRFTDHFILSFNNLRDIDSTTLDVIIEGQAQIKELRVIQIPSRDSTDNRARFDLEVECFMLGAEIVTTNLPLFVEKNIVNSPMDRKAFRTIASEKTEEGDDIEPDTRWLEDWNGPYNFLCRLSSILCNMGDIPADIGLDIHRTKMGKWIIYEITVSNFKSICYSMIEYIDDIKPDGYNWYYKFTTDHETNKNYFSIKFIKAKDKEQVVYLDGQRFINHYNRRYTSLSNEISIHQREKIQKMKVTCEDTEKAKKRFSSSVVNFVVGLLKK